MSTSPEGPLIDEPIFLLCPVLNALYGTTIKVDQLVIPLSGIVNWQASGFPTGSNWNVYVSPANILLNTFSAKITTATESIYGNINGTVEIDGLPLLSSGPYLIIVESWPIAKRAYGQFWVI